MEETTNAMGDLKARLDATDTEIAQLKSIIKGKDAEILELKEKIAVLEAGREGKDDEETLTQDDIASFLRRELTAVKTIVEAIQHRMPERCEKVRLETYVGDPDNCVISNASGRFQVEFAPQRNTTYAAPKALVRHKEKAYYECQVLGTIWPDKFHDFLSVGWVTTGYQPSTKHDDREVGYCGSSWGYSPIKSLIAHDEKESEYFYKYRNYFYECKEGVVVGVAVDMSAGQILYSINGKWGQPRGVAFDNIDTGLELFPALSGSNCKVMVNFGKDEFKYAPPDDTYKKLGELGC